MIYPDYGPTTKYLSGVIDDRTNYQNIRFEYRPRNWSDDGRNVGRNSLFIRSEIPIDTDKVFIKFFKRKNRRWRNISSLNFGYLHDESGRDSDVGTVIYSPIGKLERRSGSAWCSYEDYGTCYVQVWHDEEAEYRELENMYNLLYFLYR